MSIKKMSHNKWLVRIRHRNNGKLVEKKQVVIGIRRDAEKVEIQFKTELYKTSGKSSLTIKTFSEALDYYRAHTTADLKKINCLFDRMITDIGTVPISELAHRFGEYLTVLKLDRSKTSGELLTVITRNKLLGYAKIAINFCIRRGLIEKNPLIGYVKESESSRDRILSPDEEFRLLATLERNKSYLLMPVKFSLRNPIRKGDLISLTRENLDRFRPWIHFLASKTKSKKQRETVLPFLDNELLAYFDNLPAECPYLFPREFGSLGDFKNHWRTMLRESRIEDFHWHDLKHCAVTWMLDNGYTERDLRNLGIQYSSAMINRYYHNDAAKVLSKWKIPKIQKTAT